MGKILITADSDISYCATFPGLALAIAVGHEAIPEGIREAIVVDFT